jgi:streptogramin lyase
LLNDPVGVAIDAHGSIFVADFNSGGGGALLRVDPLTGAQAVATTSQLPASPRGVTIGPDGMLYVTCDNSEVVRVDPATGTQAAVTSGNRLVVPEQLAFDATGKLVVADAQGGGPGTDGPTGSVVGVDVTDGSQSAVSTGGVHWPWAWSSSRRARCWSATSHRSPAAATRRASFG